MPETLAIQIDQNLIQIARARSGDSGPELVEIVTHDVPEGQDPLAEAAALLQMHKGSAVRTAVALAWRHYSIREKWLQLTSEADIRSVLKFELADDLAADPQTLVMPFQIVEERPEGAHVVAWSAAKQDIAQLMGLMQSAGLGPDFIPPDAAGHIGLVAALAPQVAGQPIIAINGDSRGVNLSLMQDGLIWAHRRLTTLHWATEAAGQPLQEIRRLMLSAPGFPPAAAVVSFGPETADTLANVLAGELQCPHLHIAPPPQAGQTQAWPLAAGIALSMASQEQLPISFRQEEFEPRESARTVGMLTALALGLLGVCLIVGGFKFMLEAKHHKSVERRFQELAAKTWKEHVDSNVPMLAMYPLQLNNRTRDLRASLETARNNQDEQPIYRYLVQALVAVPGNIKYKIERIGFRDSGAVLLVTATSEDVTQLNNHLNQNRHFSSVLQSDAGSEGESRYTLTLTYKAQNVAGKI